MQLGVVPALAGAEDGGVRVAHGLEWQSERTASGQPIEIGFGELAEAVVAGFAEAWGVAFEAGELSGRERAIERELRAEKYTSDAWTFGR